MLDAVKRAFRAFSDAVAEKVGAGITIREDHLEKPLEDLEILLIKGDVSLDVVERILDELKKGLVGKKVGSKGEIVERIKKTLTGMLSAMEIKPEEKPYIILLVGPNGAGKTTTVAKLAKKFMDGGKKVVVAAADTFRAGSIEQIQEWAEKIGFRVVRQEYGADPAAVAFDAVESARSRGEDVVIIDTAGRQETNRNLMDQLKKIKRVVNPHVTLFVGDATAGNALYDQIKTFHEEVGVDGIILTKMDLDVKGGGVFTASVGLGIPVAYVGTGQGGGDLEAFRPSEVVDRILG